MKKVSLKHLQEQMINYLLDDNIAIQNEIVKQGNVSKETRLNIYKNAYQARFKEVIENDHQMLGLYLGDDLFDQMVSDYIIKYPSSNTSLRYYSDNLPQYLKESTPFNQHPIISEIAHFERVLLTAFDAKDTQRLSVEDLQALEHTQWPSLNFHLHPSVQIAYYMWNSVESWQALKQEKSPEPAKNLPSVWVIWRNRDKLTEFRSLAHEELTLIKMILSGGTFSEMCDFLLKSANDEEAGAIAIQYLNTWIAQGLLRA